MTEILTTLKSIEKILLQQQGPYAKTEEALSLLGLENSRDLTYLFREGHINRYPRKGGYVYKKSELHECAERLNNRVIVLPKHK
jgi:hypothetical protein